MRKILCLLPVLSVLLAGCQLASKSDPDNPRTREPLLPPMPPGFFMQPQEIYFQALSVSRQPMAALSAGSVATAETSGYGVINQTTNGFVVEFTGWTGPYELQFSNNLTNWVTLGMATNETGIPIRVIDVRKEGDRIMFYRLKGL